MTQRRGGAGADLPEDGRRQSRTAQIAQWLRDDARFEFVRLESASSDASFRRYLRAWRADGATRVVMDAPPDKEDTAAFLQVAALLERCGVHVPRVDAVDAERGFVLLEDLGSTQYLARLRAGADPQPLYADALEALRRIQLQGVAAARELPPYDRAALECEMALMGEWFCVRHLRLTLDAEDRGVLAATFELLTCAALSQPVVFVHRDYHSRNLMWLPQGNPGILDFQDALAGPITYDLVSLLKDCYVEWPRARVQRWVADYRSRLAAQGGPVGADTQQFLRWFDLAGLQRHIKVLGIFARLWWRDGKSGYLADLPRTLRYVREAAGCYRELSDFAAWLERRVLSAFEPANAAALAQAAAQAAADSAAAPPAGPTPAS